MQLLNSCMNDAGDRNTAAAAAAIAAGCYVSMFCSTGLG
jgi:hypothetical protein